MDNGNQEIISRYEAIQKQLSDPSVIQDHLQLKKLSIEQSKLLPLYEKAAAIDKLSRDINEATELLKTEENVEMRDFYQKLFNESSEKVTQLQTELGQLISEQDPNNDRAAILEIRAGTGGDEAALFAGDLYRMYLRFAESKGWKIDLLSSAETGNGGYKEIITQFDGYGVFGLLRFESGVHRVQRVPATEAAGRIHTSAASVVVLPVVDDVEVAIKDDEIRIDVYRSSGPGGQSVNTTDSAVRITHLPTGIIVTCQDQKSQLKNKIKAMGVLKSRLYDIELQKQTAAERSTRQSAIAGGDRSAKIRTFNFPQSRVTDHRIKKSWHNLAGILDGDIEELLNTVRKELSESK